VDDLVASHCDAVYRYALRLTRSPQEADDLTQETLLRGWQHRRKLRDLGAARMWLLKITTNLHRDGVRARRKLPPLQFEASSPHPGLQGPGVEGRLEQQECVARALTALDRLPARQRQVMHLVTIEQLSSEATAEVLRISVEAVKASLSLARQAMREMLRDVYEDICGTRVKTE
jgi:RNA polymerase sigma-70 factor (ECF subfamily)